MDRDGAEQTGVPPGGGPLPAAPDAVERGGAEEALRESEARKGAILDAALDCIIVIDHEGRITEFNAAAERTFGFTRRQMVGRLLADTIIPPAFRERHRQGLARYLATGEGPALGRRLELTALRADGGEFPVELAIVPVRLPGRPPFFTGYLRDISERRKASDDLSRRAADLARSNRELEEFAYAISHDLQEPLRMVASYLELLERKYAGRLDVEAAQYIAFAVDGAQRMHYMLRDLLTYSRIDKPPEGPESVDCAAVVADALSNLKRAIEDAGAAVVVAGALPVVRGHRTLLLQLFQNLIANAVKYRGEAPPRIDVSAARRDDLWEFAVRDNGIGIDPRHHDRLFRVFQRLHERDRYPGTGIGLASAKKVVEHHGGRIWVESAAGAGAAFRFTLPAGGGGEQ